MSITTSEMTPADIAAVTGNNRNDGGMFGDGYGYRSGSYSQRGRGRSGSRYSYDEGKNYMVERLEDMLEEAGDEKEREAIRKCIQRLR